LKLAGLGIGSGESVVEFQALGPFDVIAGGATVALGVRTPRVPAKADESRLEVLIRASPAPRR
jgi:hypothetical protein